MDGVSQSEVSVLQLFESRPAFCIDDAVNMRVSNTGSQNYDETGLYNDQTFLHAPLAQPLCMLYVEMDLSASLFCTGN